MLHRPFVLAILFLLANYAVAYAADWPTYRKDIARGGVTAEALNPENLREAWVWRSALAPSQAWPGPARWDAFGKIPELRSMRNFDPVFHVTAVGTSVFFGSSSDDTVYCLDAETGKLYWTHDMKAHMWGSTFVADGKVYVGDEDGDFAVLAAAKEKKIISETNVGAAIYGTPIVANGAVYLQSNTHLFAFSDPTKAGATKDEPQKVEIKLEK